MLNGDARGPQLKGALRKGIPAWLAREEGMEELERVDAPVTVGGSGIEPGCISGWLYGPIKCESKGGNPWMGGGLAIGIVNGGTLML